jgi:hypothetical protein
MPVEKIPQVLRVPFGRALAEKERIAAEAQQAKKTKRARYASIESRRASIYLAEQSREDGVLDAARSITDDERKALIFIRMGTSHWQHYHYTQETKSHEDRMNLTPEGWEQYRRQIVKDYQGWAELGKSIAEQIFQDMQASNQTKTKVMQYVIPPRRIY